MPPVRTSSTNHRITKACYRCRHRKSKCDLRFPTCSACQRANVPCVGYDAVEGRERPRSDVAYLEDKVAQLEIELQRLRAEQSVDSSKLVDTAISTLTQSLATTISHPHHPPARALSHSSRTAAVARHPLVSLHSPVFLSQSPAPPLHAVAESPPSRPENTRCSTIALIPRHVIDIMLKNYTDIYLPQAPYIEESQLRASCEMVFAQNGATASHFDIFLVAICLAATTLIRHDEERATAAAEEFWNTAKSHLVYINDEQPWQRLRALLMLTHYGFVNPRAVNLVNTIGAALRLAVQLGLHQELPVQEQAKLDWKTIDVRRKLFWAIYSVDAACHFVLYRAFVFPRNTITAKYPESIFSTQDPSGAEQSPVTHIWPLRQYEAEVSGMLSRNGSSSLSPCPLPLEVWRKRAVQRIEEWYAATHTSGNGRPGERIEFRELMYQHNIFRLNCPSIRFPEPTSEMRKNSLNAAIAMASIYSRNTRLGKLFYIWHALFQLFDAGDMDLSAETALRRIMVPAEGSQQQQPVDSITDLLASAATPAPQRVTLDSFQDGQLPPILERVNMDEMQSIQTPIDTSWNLELFWNQSSSGAAPSLKSDELSWDFPGVDLDQIFAAFKDGQSL
ncbi:hypothetical protein SLS54_000052 [Diplodia seriata]